jgi:hypothetical protein
MEGNRYAASREGQIVLVERLVTMLQEQGAAWGVHPADLVDLIVTLIEAKEKHEAAQSSVKAAAALDAECNAVFKKMEASARLLYQKVVPSAGA